MRMFARQDFAAILDPCVENIRDGLLQIMERSCDIREVMPHLGDLLAKHFSLHSIMVCFSAPAREESLFFLHPVKSDKVAEYQLKTTLEQRYTLMNNNDPCVIYTGDHTDNTIAINFLRQTFPETKFSVLVFSIVNKADVICVLCLMRKAQNTYAEQDASLLSSLRVPLRKFFNRLRVWDEPFSEPFDTARTLSLMSLPGMRRVAEMIWSVAQQECPVLIQGETGTGKEVVADTLYRASSRIHGPFVKINCGGIPANLVDSELFGHEQGAFTDAIHTVKGRFEQAHQGVLLLDEIGELPSLAQTRLLRVLQEGTISRVGGREEIGVNVRIVAATHRNLSAMVELGLFREDLFYRLNVFTVWIPPLRERPEDIPLLASFFLQAKCDRQGWKLPQISSENLQAICAYAWPGNIRELQNAVERALIVWGGNTQKTFEIVFSEHRRYLSEAPAPLAASAGMTQRIDPLHVAMARHIRKALELAGGKISGPGGAAELLQVHPNTLRAKMQKLGVVAE